MEVKAILKNKKMRIVFYVFNGKHYVVIEHYGKNHWLEDKACETTKDQGSELYKMYIGLGYEKMPKSMCEKYSR